MADAAAYEAQRQRQVEENNRKLEELGLHRLYTALVPPTAKTLKRKARAPTAAAAVGAPIRRSGRVADLPEQPNYREGHKRSGVDAMAKAKQLQDKLGPGHPTFVKPMTQASTSSRAPILSPPVDFCRKHMPKRDEMISIVDEQDKKFVVKYLAVEYPCFSSSGWKGFITHHNLGDGDCLLFQLIQPTVFKVHVHGGFPRIVVHPSRQLVGSLGGVCRVVIMTRIVLTAYSWYTLSEQVLAKKTDGTGSSNI